MRRFAAVLLAMSVVAVATPAYASSDVTSAATKPLPVRPHGPTAHPHKVSWVSAKPIKHGRYLRLVWWSGVAPCSVLDHVKVRETRKKVVVTLYEGAKIGSEDIACVMIAVQKTTTVKLKHPLGHRKVVDGAR
jgi:hypothetical protein